MKYQSLLMVLVICGVSLAARDDEQEKIKYTITQEAWFDIAIKESRDSQQSFRVERVVIGLFGDIVPMTVTNFAQITKGFKRDIKTNKVQKSKYHYKNTPVHRIVKDFVVQMGDIIHGDGTGSKSIYGDKFLDENFILSHRSPGWVSMANYGKDTNGSQFFITLVPSRWLDGHHVVFGRVLSGMQYLRDISELETFKGLSLPKNYIEIVDCGLKEVNKYELSEDQLDNPGDINPQ